MNEELEPLSPEARDLLGWERQRPQAVPHDEQRVFERLVAAKAFAVSGAAAAGGIATATVAKLVVAAVVGVGVGGGVVGFEMSRRLDAMRSELETPKRVAAPAVPLPAPALRAEPEVKTTTTQAPAPPPRPAQRPNRPAEAPLATVAPPLPASTLRDESALIEQARMALLKGEYSDAEAALGSYRTRFPAGHLLEEQELLSVQVLLGQHRDEDARRAAAQFRQQHVGSPLIPALDALIEEP